jgi:putative transposase
MCDAGGLEVVIMPRNAYPSDLPDAAWAIIQPLLPPPAPTGHPVVHERRDLVDTSFSHLRQDGAWRGLPHDLPPWQTGQWCFRRWREDGTWKRVVAILRERDRVCRGRHPQLSAACIDSQSVKTAENGGLAGTTAARR